jgi:hypothetical protein
MERKHADARCGKPLGEGEEKQQLHWHVNVRWGWEYSKAPSAV